MDLIDRKILDVLQQDATLSMAELGERVGLSATPCWRRVQRLEAAGVIAKRVVLLDREQLNVGTTVFVAIRTREHSAEWLERFATTISEIPEVVDFYRMSGDVDYLLRLVVPDIAAYDQVYKKLIKVDGLSDVTSTFAMEEIKHTTALPLGYAGSGGPGAGRGR
ncbi:MAG: Lrp/AsnC family transcriptional regulator [Azospirillaceae bacterium]